MRVTQQMLTNRTLAQFNSLQSNLIDYSEQLSSGTRVTKPSDDPLAAARASSYEQIQAQAESHLQSSQQVMIGIDAVDGALGEAYNLIIQAKSLALQASNETMGSEERSSIASEIDAVYQSMLSIANTTVDGNYVFSGMLEDTASFDATGVYQGDSNRKTAQIGANHFIEQNGRGDVAFGGSGGGVNVFTELQTLSTALNANDTATIQNSLDAIDTAGQQLIQERTRVGAVAQELDLSQEISQTIVDNTTKNIGSLTDADYTEAITKFTQIEQALEASTSILSKLLSSTSLNRLLNL